MSTIIERPPRITLSPSSVVANGSSMFSVSMRWLPVTAIGGWGQRKFDAFACRIHHEQKAVIDHRASLVVAHLKRVAIQHDGKGAVPLRIPRIVR